MEKMLFKLKKAKVFALMLALVIACTYMPNLTYAEGFSGGGDGTAANPFQINSIETLKEFADGVNSGAYASAHAVLLQDLENVGTLQVIGTVAKKYQGTFDGQGHMISGFEIDGQKKETGFFGVLDGATIKNLSLKGNVSSEAQKTGGLAGWVWKADITNCEFVGNVTNTENGKLSLGGLVGEVKTSATIKACNAKVDITANGVTNVGGLVGFSKKTSIEDSYMTGSIIAEKTKGALVGNFGTTTVENSYADVNGANNLIGKTYGASNIAKRAFYKLKLVENGSVTEKNCATITTKEALLEALNTGKDPQPFKADTQNINKGYPILQWEKVASTPPQNGAKLELLGTATAYMKNSETTQEPLTINVKAKNVPQEATISYEYSAGYDKIAKIEEKKEGENLNLVITPLAGGVFSIVAKAEKDGQAICTSEPKKITIIPFCTTVDMMIGGEKATVAHEGDKVTAVLNVLGGTPYEDIAGLPQLTYQWYVYEPTPNKMEELPGQNQKALTLTQSCVDKKVGVEIFVEGRKVHDKSDQQIQVFSSDRKKLLVLAKECLSKLPDRIEKNTEKIELPKTYKKDDLTSENIEWSCNVNGQENGTIASDGKVNHPQREDITVSLQGVFKGNNSYTGIVKVSKDIVVEAKNPYSNEEKELKKVIEEANKLARIYPDADVDTNINEYFLKKLKEKGIETVDVKLVKADRINNAKSGNIAADGTLTYFYEDPNSVPVNRVASFDVQMEISLKAKPQTKGIVNTKVILGWDREKVREQIKNEIVSKVVIDTDKVREKAFDLPKIVDGKKWVGIKWQTGNPDVVSISGENQKTADTLFEPYVAQLHRGDTQKETTLTASFTFNFIGNSGFEKDIVINEVYNIKVAKLDADAVNAKKKELENILERGLEKAPLADYVTGEKLEMQDGKYIVKNDIAFPKTKDFGVDGKYLPIRLESEDQGLVENPNVNNAARMSVLRPVDNASETILHLKITDTATGISAEKSFQVKVLALTEDEINAEKALMTKVKAAYFDGIRGANISKDDISANLQSFLEVYEENGKLVWVRDNAKRKNFGIVPTPIDGWQDLEAFRLFKSSAPKSITHETLIVTQKENAKAVTVESKLSGETLGKYGKLYKDDPVKYAKYEKLADLWYQPVSAELVVRGKTTKANEKPQAKSEKISVTFTLQDAESTLIANTKYADLPESTTAFEIFKKALDDNHYTYKARGSYVYEISTNDGRTYTELGTGKNSGWLYTVNGEAPNVYMGACGLDNGDAVKVFYTHDYTKEKVLQHWRSAEKVENKDEKPAETVQPVQLPKVDVSPEKVKIVAEKFADVAESDWHAKSISFVYSQNLMKGVSESDFGTLKAMDRAMAVTVLYRLAGEPSVAQTGGFSDVPAGSYYEKAVAWANKSGISFGYGHGVFGSNDELTREQFAALLMRYAKLAGYKNNQKSDLASFTDAGKVNSYSLEAMKWANGVGIINGRGDGTLAPNAAITRSEMATMIMNFCEKAA